MYSNLGNYVISPNGKFSSGIKFKSRVGSRLIKTGNSVEIWQIGRAFVLADTPAIYNTIEVIICMHVLHNYVLHAWLAGCAMLCTCHSTTAVVEALHKPVSATVNLVWTRHLNRMLC